MFPITYIVKNYRRRFHDGIFPTLVYDVLNTIVPPYIYREELYQICTWMSEQYAIKWD